MMREEPVGEPKPKSFEISKRAVWEAYRRVKANKGGAGVDEQSITEFEVALKDNLYPRRYARWRYRRRTAAQEF